MLVRDKAFLNLVFCAMALCVIAFTIAVHRFYLRDGTLVDARSQPVKFWGIIGIALLMMGLVVAASLDTLGLIKLPK